VNFGIQILHQKSLENYLNFMKIEPGISGRFNLSMGGDQ
jgi:hypothetical protein